MRIGECLQFGWDTWKRHASALVLIAFVLLLANATAQFAAGAVLRGYGSVVSLLVTGLFWGGMMVAARKAARGEVPTVSDAFSPFTERPGDYILVGLAVVLGLLACGVGFFVTSYLFLFAPLCVAEGGDWQQSLTRSKDLVLANMGETVAFYLVLAALNLAGALAFGVGLLVTMPVTALAIVKAYELASARAVLPPSGPAAV